MKASKELLASLRKHEGFRSQPYRCTTGALTVGYGRNLDAKGVSKASAEQMLREDADDALKDARFYILCADAWSQMVPARRDVIIEMAFNLGLTRLRSFVRLRQSIIQLDWEQAAKEMLNSKWANQVGNRAVRLAEQMRSGIYEPDLASSTGL